MSDPDFATFRDVVDVVERVETKLDEHKTETEKRLGRMEKGLLLVGVLALVHPQLPVKSLPFFEGAVHAINALSLIH